jgi:protein MpaA
MLAAVNEAFNWSDFLPAFEAAASAAGFRPSIYGTTAAGDLIAWEKPGQGLRTYLSAGIHGDEPAGPLALLELVRSGAFEAEGSWAICPALNPTGLAAGLRENSEGRDLNRDYWVLSSSETSAHADWLKSVGFADRFISLHEDWETTGFYFYEINCGEDCPSRAHAILEAVAPWFPPESSSVVDGHEVREPGWIYHAAEADMPENWPEAIYLAKNGCPLSFTFETPSTAHLVDRIAAHVAAVKAVIAS